MASRFSPTISRLILARRRRLGFGNSPQAILFIDGLRLAGLEWTPLAELD